MKLHEWLEQVGEGHEARLVISHEACAGEIALHGGHLLRWRAAGREEALYVSPEAIFAEGKAIRGGVPVCWPWFGGEGKPAHGLVRTRMWELEDACEIEGGVRVVLRIASDAETREIWPYEFVLRMEFELGEVLRMNCVSENVGDEAWEESGALHTYLAVDAIENVRISGLDGVKYRETATGREGDFVQVGEVEFGCEVDRVYASAGTVVLRDGAREIAIEKEESEATVVWNPWVAKAAALGDLPDEDFSRFVCVEAVNLREHGRRVKPGERASFSQVLRWR